MPTRRDVLRVWEQRFQDEHLDSPRLSAQVLLAWVLSFDRLEMLLHLDVPLTPEESERFSVLAARRLQGEPVAYLIEQREFYGRDFFVDARVLIPRPETEELVDLVSASLAQRPASLIVDIGAGSGVLGATLALKHPGMFLVGLDISGAALCVARRNYASHGLLARTSLVQADLLNGLNLWSCSSALMVANLPYVPERTRAELSREVCAFEPELALFSGRDGLDCYRRLASFCTHLPAGTRLFCEIDASQGASVHELFSFASEVILTPDYSNRDRFVSVVF